MSWDSFLTSDYVAWNGSMEAVIHAKFKLKHSETFQENSMMESIFGKLKDVVAFMRHLQNFCLFLENLWKAASVLTLPAPIPDKENINS